ncbi:MAG: class I SAM-dependent methyltransferase [Ruminiclostridium sp.]|nr:class I SAM-dependent methyltransferase [Ruminiclostridium sp.]
MDQDRKIKYFACKNYSESAPWPDDDIWHQYTYSIEKSAVEQWLAHNATDSMRILNAGSGGTQYETRGTIIHLDIIKEYIEKYDNYIVGSVEQIALPDNSVDAVICVGSVLNYSDAQKSIAELSRVLKNGGYFALEFERSDSAEFLWTPEHGKDIFFKTYHYNGQEHPLWLYSEKHVRQILLQYHLDVQECKRIHCISSLLYRFGVSEMRSAPYSKLDTFARWMSYPLAHNVMLFGRKAILAKGDN